MDFTEKYTNDKDQRLLLRKINDLIQTSRKQYTVTYSSFLDPAQQALILSVTEFYGLIEMTGGYDDAERRVCRIRTDDFNAEPEPPFVLLTAEATDKTAVLSHRDVLGALMGLGIKREMIGDILPNGHTAQFFCLSGMAEYLLTNLAKIGRYTIHLTHSDTAQLIAQPTRTRTVNVSAMRLDCIAAEGFGLSRTKAADAIRKGLVSLNWVICTDPSQEIKSGDRLSLRGKGKLSVGTLSGPSKKGRLSLDLIIST